MQYTLLYTKDLNWTKGFSRSQKRCGFRLNWGDMCWKEESCQITFDCKPFVICLYIFNQYSIGLNMNRTWFDRCFHIGSHNSLRYFWLNPSNPSTRRKKKGIVLSSFNGFLTNSLLFSTRKNGWKNSHPLMEGSSFPCQAKAFAEGFYKCAEVSWKRTWCWDVSTSKTWDVSNGIFVAKTWPGTVFFLNWILGIQDFGILDFESRHLK